MQATLQILAIKDLLFAVEAAPRVIVLQDAFFRRRALVTNTYQKNKEGHTLWQVKTYTVIPPATANKWHPVHGIQRWYEVSGNHFTCPPTSQSASEGISSGYWGQKEITDLKVLNMLFEAVKHGKLLKIVPYVADSMHGMQTEFHPKTLQISSRSWYIKNQSLVQETYFPEIGTCQQRTYSEYAPKERDQARVRQIEEYHENGVMKLLSRFQPREGPNKYQSIPVTSFSWNDAGELLRECKDLGNTKEMRTLYFDGKKLSQCEYGPQNTKSGPSLFWHPNGVLQTRCTYENGHLDGIREEYGPDGLLLAIYQHKKNQQALWVYHSKNYRPNETAFPANTPNTEVHRVYLQKLEESKQAIKERKEQQKKEEAKMKKEAKRIKKPS